MAHALYEQGYTYEVLGEGRKAIKCFEDALNIDEENIDVLNEIAYTHQTFGEDEKSIDYLDKVLKIDERNNRALDNIAYSYKNLKKYNMALEYLTKSIKLEERTGDPNFAANEMVDVYFLKDDDETKAMTMGQQLIKDEKANSRTYWAVGWCHVEKENYDDAVNALKESLRLEWHVDAVLELGVCYQNKEMMDVAILYYEKGLARKKTSRDLWLTNLGICYYRKKEYQTALNNFEEALEADPKYLMRFGTLFFCNNIFLNLSAINL
jgi:tetratricopeptide (TPR) repeat protein